MAYGYGMRSYSKKSRSRLKCIAVGVCDSGDGVVFWALAVLEPRKMITKVFITVCSYKRTRTWTCVFACLATVLSAGLEIKWNLGLRLQPTAPGAIST